MPGSGVGDRVHKFFGQENFSQGQHLPQIVDGNWPGLNNALPAGSQIQINASTSFNPNLKIYNLQQSDSERAYGGQSFDIPHGLNLMQSAFRPELGRSHSQSQQPVLGGHMYGHQVFQTRQNGMNHLGADSDSNRHNLMSRGFSMLEAQQQSSGQHSGLLQSLSRQHSGVSDMQLLQQQAMFKQMLELQRQQLQRQQEENVNQFTANSNQAMGNCATLINGIPVHDASNSSWPPETVAVDSNWLQRGSCPVMQGPSGHMISSQRNQALQLMDMVPQQADNSFNGVPVFSTGNLSQYSHSQRVCVNSFSGNHYTAHEQVSKRDAASRQEIHGESMSGHAAGQRNFENDLKNSQQLESALIPDLHEKHELARLAETSKEKPATPVDTSHNVATLDPTEEKILFGSDDSVWDVFVTSAGTGMGAPNMLDATDFALPSMSSGTWSALMQSAVAETSSGDVALQEPWCGSSFHSTEPQTRNLQTSANITGEEPQPVWPDGSLHNSSSLNRMPSPFPGDAGTRTSYGSISGDLKSGFEIGHNRTRNLQADPSQRSMQQFSVDEKKCLDQNSLREGLLQGDNVCANVSSSLGTESNVKSTSRSWTYQSSALSYNNNDHQSNGQIGWSVIDSFSPAGVANSRGRRNETDGDIRDKMGEAANYLNVGSPHVERELGGSNIGGLQINKEIPKVDCAAIANLQNTKANPEDSQQLLDDRNITFWKHVSPSVSSRGSTTPNNFQPNMVTHSHSFALTGNDGLDKGAAEKHVDGSNKKENSSDSFCSIASQNTSGGSGRKENVWVNAGDSHNLVGSRAKSSNQVGQRPAGVRKFHFHPMGDVEVDVELSHGSKQNINTQSMHQQLSRGFKGDQGHPGQPKFSSSIANSSVEADQGQTPACGQPEGLHVDPSKGMISAYAHDASANFDGSVGNFSNSAPSKYMPEFFHEADKLKGHHPSRNLSSSNFHSSSEMPVAENAFGAGHNQLEKSSVSQNFGLQLGLPSQRSIIKDQTSFSQSPELNSLNSSYMSSGAFLRAANQGNNSTAFCSRSPYQINHLQHMAFANSSGQSSTHQSADLSFNGSNMQLLQTDASSEKSRNPDLASVSNVARSAQSNDLFPPAETCQPNNTDQSHMRDPCQELPSSEAMPFSQPSDAGMLRECPSVDLSPKLQHNSPSQQQSLGGHASDFSNSHTQPKYDVQRTISGEQNPDGQHAQGNRSCDTVASDPQGVGESQSMTADMQHQMSSEDGSAQNPLGTSHGSASIVNHLPDASLSTSITQRDIEVFSRSLRPNNISENLSLLHQMQSMRKAEADPSNRSVKRSRGSDPESVASRGVEKIFNYTVKDASINHTPAFSRGVHPEISPQMAPSWFDQYGTFKNGQILPVYGAKTSMGVDAVDHPTIAGGSSKNSLAFSSLDKLDSVTDASQPDNIQQSANPVLMAHEQFSFPRLLPPQVNDESFDVETKKRKSGTFEVLPWCKEGMQRSRGLKNSRMSEVVWAQATNRLIEKVEDDNYLIEDVMPIRRSKRRLVITTRLLQQLLRPPPASVISSDATAHNEDLVYHISRLALGDACSSISFKNDSYSSRGSRSPPSDKSKESERFDEVLSKVAENFIGRAKKLENFLKLEKGVSVLDLRLECEDLEKFSVINRFAKFHSRSQADGAENLSSSDANANSQKPCPQRYVTAVPMPRNIPDRVQCLSL